MFEPRLPKSKTAKIDPELIACLASVPLYAGLTEEETADVTFGLRLIRFKAGDTIVRQGAKADGVYFILSGDVEVTIALPGGGEIHVTELGPGSLLGELAMIRAVPRNATATAKGLVEAIYADWRFLSAALAQLRPGAFKVFRQMARVLAARTRTVHEKIRAAAMSDDRPYEMLRLSPPKRTDGEPAPCDFDVGAFLPLLPCFRRFDAAGLDALQSRAKPIDAERGLQIAAADEIPERAFVVIRGAVASGFQNGGRIHLINVRGPGSFCNVSAVIDGLPVSASYAVCENAVLLELSRPDFNELFMGLDQTAHDFITAIIEHQAGTVSRATNHLQRMMGLARLIHQLRSNPVIGAASVIS
jgi:CRP/FNR family cyclic AMP-dependent transcriptional regulator